MALKDHILLILEDKIAVKRLISLSFPFKARIVNPRQFCRIFPQLLKKISPIFSCQKSFYYNLLCLDRFLLLYSLVTPLSFLMLVFNLERKITNIKLNHKAFSVHNVLGQTVTVYPLVTRHRNISLVKLQLM